MRKTALSIGVATVMFTTSVFAGGFSTSSVSPTPLPATGVIDGGYPVGNSETTYYFSADLKAGKLATQVSYKGAPDSSKLLEFELLDPSGSSIDNFYIKSFGQNYEGVRVFDIDNSGTHLIKVKLKGPETASFKVDLGGTALPSKPAAATGGAFSSSFIAPAALPAEGLIEGRIPKGEGVLTNYYFAVDVKGGELLTQISMSGSGKTSNMIELAVIKPDGRELDSYYTKSFEPNHEATRAFQIENSGRYILRVTVQGSETARFKAEVGGSAVVVSN
jgi:hypothetical protein